MSHYCSETCQKADWHAVHKYEQYFYKLGAAGDGGDVVSEQREDTISRVPNPDAKRGGSDGGTTTTDVTSSQTFKEINEDRLDYDRLLSLQRQYMANREPDKKERAMTHQQRAERELRMSHMIIDPTEQRRAHRAQFIDTVVTMVEIVGEAGGVPSSEKDGEARPVSLDEEALARLSILFRKHDLLALRYVYALSTQRKEDYDEYTRYRIYVEDQERHFVHALFFAGDPRLSSYEETLRNRHDQEREAFVEEYSQHLLNECIDSTVDVCTRYMEALDRKEKKQQQSGHYGPRIPVKDVGGGGGTTTASSTSGGGGDQGEQEQNDNNLINMVAAKAGDESDGYSEKNVLSVMDTMMGANRAQLNRAEQEGAIDEETRQGSESFVRGLLNSWKRRDVLKVVGQNKTLFSWEGATGYMKQIQEKLSVRHGINNQWWQRFKSNLSIGGVASILLMILLFRFSVVIFGYTFFGDPMTPEARVQYDTSTAMVTQFDTGLTETKGALDDVATVKDAVKVYQGIINGTSGGRQYMGLQVHNNPVLDSIQNRLLVNSTMTGLLEDVNRQIDEELARVREELLIIQSQTRATGVAQLSNEEESNYHMEDLLKFRTLIESILYSPSLNACRNKMADLQRHLAGRTTIITNAGLAVVTEKVQEILDRFEKFAEIMDFRLSKLNGMLTAHHGNLSALREATLTQREKMLDAAMKAPTMGSLLALAGQGSSLVSYLAGPAAEMATLYFFASFLGGDRLLGAFGHADRTEMLFHNLSETAGLRSAASWTAWANSTYHMAFWQSGSTEMMFYAMCTYAMLFHYLPMFHAGVRLIMRKMGEAVIKCCGRQTFVDELDEKDEDYVKAKRTVDEIKSYAAAGEDYETAVLSEWNEWGDNRLTSRQYGIAISLINNQEPSNANVWINRIGSELDAMGSLVHAVGVACRLYLYISYYMKIYDLLMFALAVLSSHYGTWGLVAIGIALVFVGIDAVMRKREKQPERPLWDYFAAPTDALFRYIILPDVTNMMAVNFFHTIIVGSGLAGAYTFTNFTDTVQPAFSGESKALAELTALTTNVSVTSASSYTTGLVAQTRELVDNTSWYTNQLALVSRGTNQEAVELAETINSMKRAPHTTNTSG